MFKAIHSDRIHEPSKEPEFKFFDGHDPSVTGGIQGVMECDGTHYEVTAFPVGKGFGGNGGSFGGDPSYLVVAFPFNHAYLMSPTNYIMESYVHSKLIPRGSIVDAENLAYLWEKTRAKGNIRFGYGDPSNAHETDE